jgi:hypothetical protein
MQVFSIKTFQPNQMQWAKKVPCKPSILNIKNFLRNKSSYEKVPNKKFLTKSSYQKVITKSS